MEEDRIFYTSLSYGGVDVTPRYPVVFDADFKTRVNFSSTQETFKFIRVAFYFEVDDSEPFFAPYVGNLVLSPETAYSIDVELPKPLHVTTMEEMRQYYGVSSDKITEHLKWYAEVSTGLSFKDPNRVAQETLKAFVGDLLTKRGRLGLLARRISEYTKIKQNQDKYCQGQPGFTKSSIEIFEACLIEIENLMSVIPKSERFSKEMYDLRLIHAEFVSDLQSLFLDIPLSGTILDRLIGV